MKTVPGLEIRLAAPEDAESIHALVCALAKFERLEESNKCTVEDLRQELSAEDGELEAILAIVDEKPVGLISFFRTYSTFAAKRGIYLEDIYIDEGYRSSGIGAQLMQALGSLAVERGYGRIEWTALLWNTPAIEFFERLGASPSDAWTTFRLDEEWLQRLSKE